MITVLFILISILITLFLLKRFTLSRLEALSERLLLTTCENDYTNPQDLTTLIFNIGVYMKIKDNWIWIEAKRKNYGVDIYALLFREDKHMVG